MADGWIDICLCMDVWVSWKNELINRKTGGQTDRQTKRQIYIDRPISPPGWIQLSTESFILFFTLHIFLSHRFSKVIVNSSVLSLYPHQAFWALSGLVMILTVVKKQTHTHNQQPAVIASWTKSRYQSQL